MGDSVNGKDCKHKNLKINWNECWFKCQNPKCGKVFWTEKEVVIRTKAYDQAREDVIAAGKPVAELAKKIKGCVIFDKIPTTPMEIVRHQYDSEAIVEIIEKFAKALDA